MSGLDSDIDALYALPLPEFTAARNQLARRHKGAAAVQIKTLAKPTTVAWSVNQLYWHERPIWQRLVHTGRALRTAQIAALEGRRSDVHKAAETHRESLATAVQHVLAHAARAQAHPAADQVARMLETVSLAQTVEHPGRFIEAVQPAGFEALLGVTPVARPSPPSIHASVRGRSNESAEAGDDDGKRAGDALGARDAEATAAAKAAARRVAEQDVERAERALQEVESRKQRAAEHVAAARQRLAEAEGAFSKESEQLTAARRELDRAKNAL